MNKGARTVLTSRNGFTVVQCVREDIPAIHAFSRHVFDNQNTPNEHPSLDEWFSRFDQRKGIILAVTSGHCIDDSGLLVTDQLDQEAICSYLFAYESKSVLSEANCMHVWLCATEPQHRGQGITRELFALVSHEATQIRQSTTILAVNTYPAYFPHMYRLLSRSDSGNCQVQATTYSIDKQ